MRYFAAVAVTVCLMLSTDSGFAQPAEGFTNHGPAAEVCRSRGATAAVDGEGRRIVMVWMMDYRGTTSKLIIDAETGETEQLDFERPRHDSPFAVLYSTRNLWYSLFADRFYEFDPATRSFSFIGETPPRCAMSLFEDRDGLIWAGMYPNAEFVSFNPDTREVVNHGRMNEETWPQYLRTLAIDEAGWVYAGIGTTRAQVVGYEPASGQIRAFIPDADRPTGTARVQLGTDGKVYANASDWGWHQLHAGQATAVENMPVSAAPMRTGAQGTLFREFPDGSRIAEFSIPRRHLVIADADGTRRKVDFDYRSEGASTFCLILGPDGAIHGSTGHPTHLFRFDLQTGELTENYMSEGSHLNDMAVQAGRIYGAHYSGGRLYEYDPAKPWTHGDETDPNPVSLGDARPHIIRPHALLAHPDGRHVIMGGTPAYGHTGGGLYIYDLEANEGVVLSHEQLLESLSTCALVALPDGNLVGGTTTAPGTGGRRLADEAELYIFDWQSRQVVWRDAILPGRQRLNDMVLGPDGLVYGIATDSTLFVFDPQQRQLVHEESLSEYGSPAGSQAPRSMALGDDGTIYMLFREAIVALSPGSFEHRKLADSPATISAGIVVHEGVIYFTSTSRLWSYRLTP